MTAWLKIGIILFVVIGSFGCGFYTAKRFDQAAQEQQAQAALAAQKDAETRTHNIADAYEKYRAGNESYIANLLSQVRKAHAKSPISPNCIVPADRMRDIQDAVTGSD